MKYSAFVIVALVIHVLITLDSFVKKDSFVEIKKYRWFLLSIGVFYITDMLWGLFEAEKLATALYIDTFVYFLAMGTTIFLWTWFVAHYLQGNKVFSKLLMIVGALFLLAEIVLLIVNFSVDLLFTVDKECVYHAFPARDGMLWAQIAMYSLIAIYSIVHTFAVEKKNYRRYIAITLFSVTMAITIGIQLGDPYLPLYTIGCLIGVTLLNNYAISDMKEIYKSAYQESEELAHTDPLTGIQNKYAYVEIEDFYDEAISKNEAKEFAVIVFDLNGLKWVNDTLGHETGDKYIVESAKVIASFFPKDSVYRFGGDEFVAILTGEAYENRKEQFEAFKKHVMSAASGKLPSMAFGMSEYNHDADNTFRAVFVRADKAMYDCKDKQKLLAK